MYLYRLGQIRSWIRLAVIIAAGLLLLTAAGLVIDVSVNPAPAGPASPPPVPAPPWGAP